MCYFLKYPVCIQRLSQDLETGCPKLPIFEVLGGPKCFSRKAIIYLDCNHVYLNYVFMNTISKD